MSEIIIKYKDGSGDVSERTISDIKPENSETIDAFCHLRNSRRSFKLFNIISAANAVTGEVIENPWIEFGLSKSDDGRERLESITIHILPAIKALKFLSMQLRGFAKRERKHILKFINSNADSSQYSDKELDEWLYKLWVGDVYAYRDGNHSEYEEVLNEIPNSLKEKSRNVAIAIARGSTRKEVSREIFEKINREYAE